MAAHLVTLGFEVLDERPAVEEHSNHWGDPTLGGLRVRRYGWEATGVVRIDSTGEVFIRLDPGAVAGPCCGLFLRGVVNVAPPRWAIPRADR